MNARPTKLPDEVRSLDVLDGPDSTYAGEITAWPTDIRSAEQWARAVFEGTSRPMR